MTKVVSFSLWGKNPKYTVGAIKNAEIAQKAYPDYECWFYIHKPSVPKDIIDKLSKFSNCKVILKEGDLNKCNPMNWRFQPIDEPNVQIMLSRDTDSRISKREKEAVDCWLKEGTLFHIMRDHPYHECGKRPILGGMFGTKKIPNLPNWSSVLKQFTSNQYFNDMDFLQQKVYPLIKNDSTIHATFHKYESHAKNFPTPYYKYKFVGEVYEANGTRNKEHVKALIKALG